MQIKSERKKQTKNKNKNPQLKKKFENKLLVEKYLKCLEFYQI